MVTAPKFEDPTHSGCRLSTTSTTTLRLTVKTILPRLLWLVCRRFNVPTGLRVARNAQRPAVGCSLARGIRGIVLVCARYRHITCVQNAPAPGQSVAPQTETPPGGHVRSTRGTAWPRIRAAGGAFFRAWRSQCVSGGSGAAGFRGASSRSASIRASGALNGLQAPRRSARGGAPDHGRILGFAGKGQCGVPCAEW